jgi:cysteine synthase
MSAAIDRALEVAAGIGGAFTPLQFANPANPRVHYETTGPEIHEQSGGRLDALAIGGGTCGTFTGVARFLRERIPQVRCVLVEPRGSVFGGGRPGPRRVEGIGSDFIPEVLDRSLVDEVLTVEDEEAFALAERVAREAGVLTGGSGGANLSAALIVARRLGEGARVVTVLPDRGEWGAPRAPRDRAHPGRGEEE